jgi:hypothetical protein
MTTANAPQPRRQENLLLNILFNIAIPTVVLSFLSKENRLGPALGLAVAIAFPVAYAVWDYIVRRKMNAVSVIGFASILLTGGLGVLKADGFWFAVKDAVIPLVIGVMILATLRSKRPLVHELLYNDQILNTARIDAALVERGNKAAFDALLFRSSCVLASGFLISSVTNYALARYLLKSPPNTPEFNAELAKMHLLSWPVIILPSLAISLWALWQLLKGLEKLSGLAFDDLMHQPSGAAGAAGEGPEAKG